MRISLERPVKIVMLGAGGTGAYAAPHIYRLLHVLDRPARFIIADGDTVEAKNLVRQNFINADLGENKAKVLAERYATAFGMEIEYIPEFIENEDRLRKLVTPDSISHSFITTAQFARGVKPSAMFRNLVILIGAVDNNKSRQMCHRIFKSMEELIYIDSGNGEYTGQVVCGIRRNSRTYYKPAGDLYPDILLETDKFPTELSCAEAAVSAPQSIAANIMAAAAVTSYVYNILVLGVVDVRSVTFSSRTLNIKPIITQKRASGSKGGVKTRKNTA